MPVNGDIIHLVARFVLQLSLILFAAKVGGEICERWLKQPAVLGELVSGVIIGPFALGRWLHLPYFGALFPLPPAGSIVPVSLELFAFAQLAAVILLFEAGLETDLKKFIRFGFKATLVAIGGVILPFFFGAGATIAFGLADRFMHPTALFVGAIMTATSVGITARVLADLNKLDSGEGVTIVGAAVIDDVLGILVLAIVVAISRLETSGEAIGWGRIGWIGVKAIGFWVGITALGIAAAPWIAGFFRRFRVAGARVALPLALCFLVAALTEAFGLAMIIGAYAIGLALSRPDLSRRLEETLKPVQQFVVPVFFCVMGMIVNVPAMGGMIGFGLVITLLAIVGKVFGCGLPAYLSGFNFLGASRVGLGMLPRGEVALIIAGVGLASGVIDQEIFGVSIMMTLVTTLLAPVFLVRLFAVPKAGLRGNGAAE
jgi:Kef-type K+ transport system membrane component KefB